MLAHWPSSVIYLNRQLLLFLQSVCCEGQTRQGATMENTDRCYLALSSTAGNCENCVQPHLRIAVRTDRGNLCLFLLPLPAHTHTDTNAYSRRRQRVKLTPLWSTRVISIISVALSLVSAVYSSPLPRLLLYLTVGSSFEKAGPRKFAGAPGNEGDVNWSAVDQ